MFVLVLLPPIPRSSSLLPPPSSLLSEIKNVAGAASATAPVPAHAPAHAPASSPAATDPMASSSPAPSGTPARPAAQPTQLTQPGSPSAQPVPASQRQNLLATFISVWGPGTNMMAAAMSHLFVFLFCVPFFQTCLTLMPWESVSNEASANTSSSDRHRHDYVLFPACPCAHKRTT